MQFLLRLTLATLVFVCYTVLAHAATDDSGINFIKKHLKQKSYDLDTEASAIVLYENTQEQIDGQDFNYSKRFAYKCFVKILKPDGLELANVRIYHRLNTPIMYLKGVTYNLSDTGVVATEFSKGDLLQKEIGGFVRQTSMSMPAVKVGSIIEYSYEMTEAFTGSSVAWDIQGEYPKLITEYTVTYPVFFLLTAITHVDAAAKEFRTEDSAEASGQSFCMIKQDARNYRWRFWLRRNVPGIRKEPFVVNRNNYEERIDLQITGIEHSWGVKKMNNSWADINKLLWSDVGIKKLLNANNGFLGRAVDSVLTNTMTKTEKAKAIYRFVRNNFKTRSYTKFSIPEINFRTILEKREGTADEINLMLMAMLIHEGIEAGPILLSSTDDVSADDAFPVIERLDKMACAAMIDSEIILLDASKKYLPFGFLPMEYYNGYSHILGEVGKGIILSADNLKDKTVYSISMTDVTDSTAKLEIMQRYGMIKSSLFRRQYDEEEERKEQLKKMTAALPSSLTVLSSKLINENDADTNIVIKHVCQYSFDNTRELAYINLDLVRFFESNPFKATTRQLPIEFPNKMEDILLLKIQMPAGFAPDSLSQPLILDYMDGGMIYKKSINYIASMNTLTVMANFSVNKTAYNPAHYPNIRQFFADMIADNRKLIVLKKHN